MEAAAGLAALVAEDGPVEAEDGLAEEEVGGRAEAAEVGPEAAEEVGGNPVVAAVVEAEVCS